MSRTIHTGLSTVQQFHYTPIQSGCSVRCIRDTETGSCFDPDADGVCAENEVSGCTDSAALNFNPVATEEDDSCEYPGPAQCDGQTSVTFDGYSYALVGIGTQCWFKENLRSDNYRNGDPIPGNLSDEEWNSTMSGAQTIYGEGLSVVNGGSNDEVSNFANYGRLYNWHAVNESRGICPSGFHVPSDSEFIELEITLGMSPSEANNTGWRGTDEGLHLKSTSTDNPSWDGLNTSGFSGLPSGYRYIYGYFENGGVNGSWWTSTSSESQAFNRDVVSSNSTILRKPEFTGVGFSVRCIKD